MPSGLFRCCLTVETLFLSCVLNETWTTQKCSSVSSQGRKSVMRQTLRIVISTFAKSRWQMRFQVHLLCHLDNLAVWERWSWALLNDQSLNIAVILLFFLNLLTCYKCFSTSQNIHFFFKLLETCLIPWIKLPPVSHLSFSCSFYIWPSHSLQRKVIKDNTSNR